ncbi:MAG TPA: nucleotidyltransferase substrate binding protein [Candidatus Methylacidiphilales bacterium]|nr:nucleotidyltransferase substrate binding protein [Candidatus Methylacidiphilales bacterium]
MAEKNPDVRWKQRFHSFRKALAQLKQAVQLAQERALSDLEKQGLIQAFEFNHELAWKTLKDFLESRGETEIYGSKDATRKAFAAGLIEDGEIWMEMIQSRNRSSHTYNEAIANALAQAILADYFGKFIQFEKGFIELEKT